MPSDLLSLREISGQPEPSWYKKPAPIGAGLFVENPDRKEGKLMNKNRDLQRTVNLEYAIIQGIYWAGYCALVSYAAVYLQARGYSNAGLGGILAVGYILGFLLPQVLASWVDRSERLTVYHCQWGLLIVQTVLVFLLQMMPGKSPAVSILTSLLIGAEITLNPMNTEISADLELGVCHVNYGAARGTGSIAFAPISMLLGKLLEARGIGPLPWINYGFILLQALALLSLQITVRGRVRKESVAGKSTHASSSREFFLENMGFFGLLLGVGLLFFGHNLTTNYLINIVRNVGGDTSDMGLLSGYTAIMEIPMMFLYDRLLKRVRCEDTVRFSAAMFAMKAFSVAGSDMSSFSDFTASFSTPVIPSPSSSTIFPGFSAASAPLASQI